MKKVKIAGRKVFPIGIGTSNMGDQVDRFDQEVEAIRVGLDNGVQVIDTAEMYGDGNAEKLVAHTIKPYNREELFLISKVLPSNASKKQLPISLENSLKRLNTDYLDLYLLHWKGNIPIKETIEALENAKSQGKIKSWGVSNLDVDDIEKIMTLPDGMKCATNQVRYNLGDRGIEFDLVPMMNKLEMPLIAYSPVARGDSFGTNLTKQKVLKELAERHQSDIFQILLAWCIRNGKTIAIPQSSNTTHMIDNVKAVEIQLTQQDLQQLDSIYPKPSMKQPLALW
ncbi:aldo/keto reductase [Metabacillus malikii]|uniref:Diketogulonate reductase-like aldo/keto reductase n=1 Tax=Metabacillus malikii TaxID=1504265 RepID=A0ABT9ZF96_9BACI|nr:aldo/keto reductase [Metabacillus malikii]MDQ0230952.1 diketogulonate reductase-like aldo/keto reductase [Metabacillus malikii]